MNMASLILLLCLCIQVRSTHSFSLRRRGNIEYDSDLRFLGDYEEENCTALVDEQSTGFEAYMLLDLQGRPSLVTPDDLAKLEESIVEAYNNATSCGQPGAFRMIDFAEIQPDAIDAFGDNLNPEVPGRAQLVRNFTYLVKLGGECNACPGSTPLLFKNETQDTGVLTTSKNKYKRHLQDDMGHRITEIVLSPDANGAQSMNQGISNNLVRQLGKGGDKMKSNSKRERAIDFCDCEGPDRFDFLDRTTQLYSEVTEPDTRAVDIFATVNNNSSGITLFIKATQVAYQDGCEPANFTVFNTSIAITVTADFYENATPEDIAQLEQDFLESYNEANRLNADICDLLQREVIDAKVNDESFRFNRNLDGHPIEDDAARNLQSNISAAPSESVAPSVSSVPSSAPTFPAFARRNSFVQVLLFVSGRCFRCTSDQTLFDQTSGRRRLRHEQEADDVNPRFLEDVSFDNTTDCLCPVDDVENRAPFIDEVFRLLQEQTKGVVLRFAEVEEVDCSAEINTFTTEVTVLLTIERELTAGEIFELEQGFVLVYNALAERYCDSLHRTILNATIPVPPKPGMDVPVLFEVTGRCRCVDPPGLFSKAIPSRARYVPFGGSAGGDHRSLRQLEEDTCFCDVNAIDDRAPTEEEFIAALEAYLPGSDLGDIVVAPTDPPSTAPSASPSLSPSELPTESPSALPSSFPSLFPSEFPTRSPSGTPTVGGCTMEGCSCVQAVLVNSTDVIVDGETPSFFEGFTDFNDPLFFDEDADDCPECETPCNSGSENEDVDFSPGFWFEATETGMNSNILVELGVFDIATDDDRWAITIYSGTCGNLTCVSSVISDECVEGFSQSESIGEGESLYFLVHPVNVTESNSSFTATFAFFDPR